MRELWGSENDLLKKKKTNYRISKSKNFSPRACRNNQPSGVSAYSLATASINPEYRLCNKFPLGG